ncbi:phosphatidylglycerol:prolipoprotein diacylglycerol transferase [Clostridium tetanomorphum]|uniref:Phosphatidylglycerol--prolipoprotein diacylglyceryl transferase n=1 Tax=Clostridium tetanomorphum TaxID=1553 RepID=A0A923J1Z8_CLOTT|nr:prolipoprotein diacylglyceryl transferase [Clostridium tetanomorphum]KAJ49855.1 prolipoprotein diacylglyceryl transferase [Clostridium tetanomorphum DSM 665]MBC2399309.1 prolipoprotein diacylglyceryl transferase [Clostridium tetanomorphum]MBP1866114.1 phosphatidylglycerol:prolipoprotein diacylglycerol transferase [Clostridium tetanomorphum]NRS86742.1 phosphatidylglycerol:prolipoprotein diacylglycerol transferase [Clostridium tetanomorphum]NRZ99505.1 phosphatidylglycerol:prolipoprotein diacy
MKPVLFKIFGLPIYSYGTMIALGILAALVLLNVRTKNNYNEDDILSMSIIAIISGVVGGKLLYMITDIKSILEEPSILKNLGNGFVIYGAIIGGALSVYLFCKKKGWKALKMFDIAIPSIALAQGFGRIGCFLAGCCYGKATKLAIGVEFTKSPFAPSGVLRHPTQLYSSIFDFCLAFFLLWYDRKKRKEGRVFSLYVIIYGIGRIIVEFFRDDPRGEIGMLSTSQFISLFTIILGIIIFNINKFSKSKSEDKNIYN